MFHRLGIDVRRCTTTERGEVIDPNFWADLSAADQKIIGAVTPYTMTSSKNIAALIDAVRYVVRAHVKGSIVECGVWRGGSMMTAALALRDAQDTDRDLYLFDTYQGLPKPSNRDTDFRGKLAADIMRETPDRTSPNGNWCYASLDDVRANMHRVDFAPDRVHFIEGKVEETIPHPGLSQIALLRLDTDWYESTRHCLQQLFPLLSIGGVLILDDYGDWKGAREATDEYFAEHPDSPVLLMRAHRGVRLAIKALKSDCGD
jgi:hypothetical protein